ncbi:hypothetical protein [Natronolimnobius baerhuensis]|uniref:Uncharacterized protein n=1 Tax=Natronolimnobius baerhuensis TaxID=253108 RepID=A0A202E9T7_9EURY|nr:hypothetical protein [Natronolimnobius baerhuensis]OVE84987.1 hypothetical protein B2G88_11570 [Natronolimnobius baerhuensis]
MVDVPKQLAPADIDIEAREPRHRLDDPVLLAWVVSEAEVIEWAVDLSDDGIAHVVCRDSYDKSTPESVTSEAIPATEPIPQQLALALTAYSGQFSPIEAVVNPVASSE